MNPLLKNWPDSTVRGSLYTFFKIRTDSAVHGLLHPFYKFGPKQRSVDLCIMQTAFPFKRSDQIGSPWIPVVLFINLDRFGRPWVHPSPFINSDQIGGPLIPVSPLKIRTGSAVLGPSMDFSFKNPRDFTWGERMSHNLPFDQYDSFNFHHNH